jgi:hypothetical protein
MGLEIYAYLEATQEQALQALVEFASIPASVRTPPTATA